MANPFVLLGAALDTSNLGCSALSMSVILGIRQRFPNAHVAVGDFGRGFRTRIIANGNTGEEVTLFGSVNTRRVYRSDSIYGMAVCSAFGGLGHPVIRLYRGATAILDISGGDSFSDIYGPRFFRSITLRKRLAIKEGKSLILLPQTYGPYKSESSRKIAQDIVRKCTMAWARDEHSFEVLQDLLGSEFDPLRHRVGVDVAFELPIIRPTEAFFSDCAVEFDDSQTPLVGLNVSGLLMNRPQDAIEQYGLRADYRSAILSFVRRLINFTDARVLLVPHVVTSPGHYESDIQACEYIASALRDVSAGRVSVGPAVNDPREAKWIIAQCDWFCGTRMHSTIAALSSGVPTAAISYSPKTLGVFETCAQGAHVADPRELTTEEVVDCLWQSWLDRELARESLRTALPRVLGKAESQMDEIVSACVSSPSSHPVQVR